MSTQPEPLPEAMPDEAFWMVWTPGGTEPTFRHISRVSAENEADRLSRRHAGQIFFVLCAETAFRRIEVQRQRLHEPIPF